jgi:hypothetical protein
MVEVAPTSRKRREKWGTRRDMLPRDVGHPSLTRQLLLLVGLGMLSDADTLASQLAAG